MAENLSAALGWQLADAVRGMVKEKTKPSTGTATYVGTDSMGHALILFPGADQPTPVHGPVSAQAEAGSTVTYSLSNGQLSITGNATDPAVGESKASEIASGAVRPLAIAQRAIGATADAAKAMAEAAKRVADATNQHFFTDDNGIHVTSVAQDEWDAQHAGPNVLVNSIGQLFRDGLNNLLTLTTENGARALTIWDGAGNAAANVVAFFGEIVRIGRAGYANVTIDTDSIDLNISNIVAGALQLISEASRVGAQLLFYDGAARVSGCVTRGGIVEVSIGAQGTSVTIDSAGNLAMADGTTSGSVPIEDALKAIAAQCGSVGQTTSVPAGGYANVAVTFDRPYDSTPTVVVGLNSSSTSSAIGACSVAVASVTSSGFTARLFNSGSSSRKPGFYWIAMGASVS